MPSETWDIGDALGNLSFTDLANLLSQYHQIANTSPGTNLYFDPPGDEVQPSGQGTTATPGDYSSDVPPSLMGQYEQLVKGGLPPAVARSILPQPSYGEGERPHSTPAWTPTTPYAHSDIDPSGPSASNPQWAPPEMMALMQQLVNRQAWDKQNQPVPEEHPQYYDPSGLFKLPTGQYVPPMYKPLPQDQSLLDYYRNQGNPSSFYWNPQPGSFWGNNLLYGQTPFQDYSSAGGDAYQPPQGSQ